jgi:hypothetical protein
MEMIPPAASRLAQPRRVLAALFRVMTQAWADRANIESPLFFSPLL